eukprot:TRINITY_DN28968_c0_g1_i6.p3 TRINITY_DN28968_c0_g1~~TRINITY_DN28968_c0_g1_i6.p3  ORF type:complete len:122 (-),score=11.63 TRINITY_DN28968_c0_g1_i6:10-375(-)
MVCCDQDAGGQKGSMTCRSAGRVNQEMASCRVLLGETDQSGQFLFVVFCIRASVVRNLDSLRRTCERKKTKKKKESTRNNKEKVQQKAQKDKKDKGQARTKKEIQEKSEKYMVVKKNQNKD